MNAAEAALRERIGAEGGSVAFEDFMRFALYDPEHGYYARRVRTVGREGDFSTSATLHPALADAVAAWAAAHRKDGTGADGRWHLIELGGGTGEMAARALRSLGWWARRKVRYHLVEVSAGLRAARRVNLTRWAKGVSWHGTLAEALAAARGTALIFSNELVDAFPCARWAFDPAAGWREIRVVWNDVVGEAAERTAEPVSAARLAAAAVATTGAMPGQRVEVFETYRAWQQEQLGGWNRGRLLTIDYGDETPVLYHRRPAGTLRAYCRQVRFTGHEVYARVGQQDLTADVNFTDLRRWGAEWGLVTAGYGTQAEFLGRWLPPGRVRAAPRDPRLAYLLDPEAAGGAFKVLEQTRGCSPPTG